MASYLSEPSSSFTSERTVHLPQLAYIDPGAGSLIIQAAIATLVAIPFFLRQQIGRAMNSIRRRGDTAENLPANPREDAHAPK
jgi:hypothetical protein